MTKSKNSPSHRNGMDRLPGGEIVYRYMKARTTKQVLTYDDLMRTYNMVITIYDKEQACHLWDIVKQKVNFNIFESGSDFNHAVLDAISEHKKTHRFSGKKRRRG